MAGPDTSSGDATGTGGGARGLFITFEGGDGVGKSTQIELLADYLRGRGLDVVTTREPGGTPGAEAVRALLVSGAADRWSPMSEALMMYAARADHLEKIINPARSRGAVVICDRFSDSTMAYQGVAGSLGAATVTQLEKLVVGADGPDLTFIFDLGEDEALDRARDRAGAQDEKEARFEGKGRDYQSRVRAAFLRIAKEHPRRCVLIDAAQKIETIAAKVKRIADERLAS